MVGSSGYLFLVRFIEVRARPRLVGNVPPQNLLEYAQEWSALFIAFLAQRRNPQMNLLAAAARQSHHDSVEQGGLRFGFHVVGPLQVRRIAAPQHVRMRERLLKPFPPRTAANV